MASKQTPPKTAAKSPKARTRRKAPARQGSGLFGYALGAVSVAAGALLTVFMAREVSRRRGSAEHVPTDLLGDTRPAPTDRAPDAFRPDPTAPVPAGERESLRPATGPAPTLVEG